MSPQRIAGLILLVAGVVILIMGINASHSTADQWTNFFTGHFTDKTTWFILGGILAGAVGLFLAFFGGNSKMSH